MIISSDNIIARIVALEPDIQPSEFLLSTDTCTIGRSPLCRIVIFRGVVSRLHAQLEFHGLSCVLSDISSTNGTFVNGQRIDSPRQLCDLDLIGLGDPSATLQFRTTASMNLVLPYTDHGIKV